MQPAPFKKTFTFANGFYASQENFEGIPETGRDGLNVWLRGRYLVSDRGPSSAGDSGDARPLQLVGGQHGGPGGGLGTVTLHSSVPWAATNGSAIIVNGVTLGVGTDKLCLIIDGTVYEAGLSAPTITPAWSASDTPGRVKKGTQSIALAKFRETTGAISNRSEPSEDVFNKKHKGVIGSVPDPGDGTTHWLVYGSRLNFGVVGPWYRITTVAPIPVADLAAGDIEIDYVDGDLGDLAPLTNDPAPTCTHCVGLGGVMCAVGSYGGYGISPSKVGEPEAYDVSLTSFLSSREAVTGLTGRGVDGGVFVATRNSISLIILSGAPEVPVLPRGIFGETGVAHGNAMCWAYDALYGFGSSGGPFRSQGSEAPDLSFAVPVIKYMLDHGFTSDNTFVVFDERNGCVIFASGDRALCFMLATGRWSFPIALPGTVTACVALGGNGLLAVGSALYTLDTAGGSPLGGWFMLSPYVGEDGRIMTIEEFNAMVKNSMTLDIYRDLSDTSIGGYFPLAFTAPHGSPRTKKPNRRARSIAFRASGSGGNEAFYKAVVIGTVEPSAA